MLKVSSGLQNIRSSDYFNKVMSLNLAGVVQEDSLITQHLD